MKIYLTVRSNYDSWVVTAMRTINIERMIFSQMPERYLGGEKGHFKLDFEYAPKGKYVGEMSLQGSKPLHIYESSLQELKELARIEEKAIARMAKKAEEVAKEREDYFRKNNAMLEEEDMAGGEGCNMNIKILECSSKGDRRFSAFYARVSAFGKVDTIENHYQLCKRVGNGIPKSWRDVKGKAVKYIVLNGKKLEPKYLTPWYKLLWVKYLDNNPHLVEYAKGFDSFSDMFSRGTINNQAQVIEQYIKQGRKSILDECQELIKILKKK